MVLADGNYQKNPFEVKKQWNKEEKYLYSISLHKILIIKAFKLSLSQWTKDFKYIKKMFKTIFHSHKNQ